MSDNFANPLQEAKSDVAKAADSISGLLNPQQEQAKTEDVKQETPKEEVQEQEIQDLKLKINLKFKNKRQKQNPKRKRLMKKKYLNKKHLRFHRNQNSTYKVKVAGQEFDVTLDELRAGYSRDSDYHERLRSCLMKKNNFSLMQKKQRQDFPKIR